MFLFIYVLDRSELSLIKSDCSTHRVPVLVNNCGKLAFNSRVHWEHTIIIRYFFNSFLVHPKHNFKLLKLKKKKNNQEMEAKKCWELRVYAFTKINLMQPWTFYLNGRVCWFYCKNEACSLANNLHANCGAHVSGHYVLRRKLHVCSVPVERPVPNWAAGSRWCGVWD